MPDQSAGGAVAAPTAPERAPVSRVADYTVVAALGRGNNGQVWLATPPQRLGVTAEQVALKVFDRLIDADEFAQVAREARRFAELRCEGLAGHYEIGRWRDRLFLATEHCSLGSLAGAPLPAADAGRAVASAARAAHALHEAGLVHRAIKPANVMRDPLGGKLTDPMLAHVLAPGLTFPGAAPLAAVTFAEPGILRGERPGRASDIWSLGATWHYALTGMPMYGSSTSREPEAVLERVMSASPQLHQDLPRPRLEIIRRCLAPDRGDRYETAFALAEDIDRTEQTLASR